MDSTPPEMPAPTCPLCGELPDDLTVNTGRDESFPEAFRSLVPVGLPAPGQGQWVGSRFHRCPECGAYFDWGDYPQVYGSGNCDEERLTRLPARASRLLETIFHSDPGAPPDPGSIGEYLDVLRPGLLLRALRGRVGADPSVVTPFVPHLARLAGESGGESGAGSIRNVVDAYASSSPARAKEIDAALARYASLILEKHLARVGVAMPRDEPPASWYDFGWRFYRHIDDLLRRGGDATPLRELLAELVGLVWAFSGEYFTDNLFELLGRFDPPHSWLRRYLPPLALVRVDELQERRWRQEEDDRRRADEMYY